MCVCERVCKLTSLIPPFPLHPSVYLALRADDQVRCLIDIHLHYISLSPPPPRLPVAYRLLVMPVLSLVDTSVMLIGAEPLRGEGLGMGLVQPQK